MHISSAAFLLLLVPATRAAAIPNQGGLSVTGDSLINKGDLPNAAINDVLGTAAARRDEAANLRGPKLVETVNKGAANSASGLAISQHDAPSPVPAKKVEKKPFNKVLPLDNTLKNTIRQEERDDTESQLREYIAQTLPMLDPAQAEDLLAEFLAATPKANSLKAVRDTTGGVAGVTNAIGGLETAEGTGGLSAETVEGEDSIDAAAAAQGSLYFPSHQSRGLTSAQLDYIKALADATTAAQDSIDLPSHQSRQLDDPLKFLTPAQADELDALLDSLAPQ